jgi:small-conductance mechanosensitive channel
VNSILWFWRIEAEDSLYLFWVKNLLVAIVIFALFQVLARLVKYFLNHWAPKFTSFTATDLDDRILERITPPVSLLVQFAGAYVAVKSLPLPEKAHVIASGLLFVVTISIVTVIAYRALDEFIHWYADGLSDQQRGGLNRQLLPLAEKLLTIFLVGTALIITLKHFNYDILSLVTALGIGSLAIGMAAKDTLANMISGFTLMLDRPFRIGDRIQLSGGQSGDVTDIGLRSTKIKTLDNMMLIIPNSDLCNTLLVNQAFPDVRAKGRINVGVAYGSDVELVKETLVATAREVDAVLKDPVPESYFVSFGDSALNMALFFWVEEYASLFKTTDTINSLIVRRFSEKGIEIPFPTRTVLLEKE